MFLQDKYRKKALSKFKAERQDAQFLSIDEIKSIGYILHLPQKNVSAIVKELSATSKKYEIDIFGLTIDMSKKLEGSIISSKVTPLLKDDFNFYGLPDHLVMKPFIGKHYDLFIDFSSEYDFSTDYIARYVDARFKVGKFNYEDNPYDFIIEMKHAEDNIAFLNLIIQYLSAINQSK